VRLVTRRTENGREVGAVEFMKQDQLADLPVHGVQPSEHGAYEGVVCRLLGESDWLGHSGKCPGVIQCLGRLIQLR
jgi:hypothetical protein